jgi:hypothetical protein
VTGRSTLRPSLAGRLILTTVAVGTLGFAWTALAAASPPIGWCPSSKWELQTSPPEDVSGTPSVDVNGDGMSCFMEAPEGGGIFTIVDNMVRGR